MSAPRPMTRAEVREVDRRAIEEFGIPGIVLMENAGRGAAEVILGMPEARSGHVAIACGCGNNGGDGFVIARHLANAGVAVDVLLAADPARVAGDALTNYRIVECMNLPMFALHGEMLATNLPRLHRATLIVDALLGTGFTGTPRPPLDSIIRAINDASAPVVAIDVPSGLDCDTGQPADPTVRADVTATFVAEKIGFAHAAEWLGRIVVIDIGAPRILVQPESI